MTGKGRILVVDDDRLVLATLVHGLAQAGFDVIDADNGDDAILLARQHRPELALLDIRMHGKTGFDVAEYLRDHARVPFLFLSAFSDDATRAKVESLGALAYLVKPLEVAQILPTVERAMKQARKEAAAPATASAPPGPPAAAPAMPRAAAKAASKQPASSSDAASALDVVALAVGIVMHSHSLGQAQARARLQAQASEKGLTLAEQAGRVVAAVEELAGHG